MATSILATAKTAAQSADFTLASGTSTTLQFKGDDDSRGYVNIEMKLADNSYQVIGKLSKGPSGRAVVIDAPGTYRVNRPAQAYNCGVDRD